jgi:hypothetical protein
MRGGIFIQQPSSSSLRPDFWHRSSLKSKDTKSSSLTSTTATRFSSACIEISGTVLILMNLIYCVVSGTIYRLACVMLISCSVTGLSLFLTQLLTHKKTTLSLARHVQPSILFVFTASIIGPNNDDQPKNPEGFSGQKRKSVGLLLIPPPEGPRCFNLDVISFSVSLEEPNRESHRPKIS